jgi:nitrogen fixation/metabolism regulation signal transduction histidine kinase
VTEAPAEPVPPDFAQHVAAHFECELRQAAKLDALEAGRRQILYVLIGACALLTIALAIYGIKMTHKVAGPLYKISLYMGKMRDGHYDKVYNLRKGDQLVSFYEHFKHAHAGVVDLEKADIERLKAILAAADAAGIAGSSPEVDAAIADLRAVLARKEKSLE